MSSQLKLVQERPFNAEAPLEILTEIPTPTQLFYVRSNFDVPQLDKATWRLRVTGTVQTPREFTFDDLQQFGQTEELVLLECAGNGRRRMVPIPSGVAWDMGAVSCAVFRGLRLADLLKSCGVQDNAVEVLCVGSDSGEVSAGRVVAFERSLPIAKALDPTVLIATAMNGAALTPEHGHPARVLVPGWYAVSSVKWLTELRVLTEPFEGHFQTERYVYIDDPHASACAPVREMRVRAIIAQPGEGAQLSAGPQTVKGLAWSGSGPIARVDVSTDGGATWGQAELNAREVAKWAFAWQADPGEYTLVARATDAAGNTQPLEPLFNQLGYGNNVAHAVKVSIRG